ncbi:hypothetical protein J2847_005892 [Azospirillum agricola]|uniref:head-tail joining protein n=1 Tax=Azospirillum agricola TaxID=1720247 RepID=UPI001AE50949|nr:hypothetical protein [Azospirillum agricola]MBP2232563.1 hypothetical protein [Azospirillum agricola]
MQHQGDLRHETANRLRFGNVLELWREAVSFDVAVSDLPNPAPGGIITLEGGASYTITGSPARRDPQRLVWTLDCSFGMPVVFRSVSGNGATQNPPQHQALRLAADAPYGSNSVSLKSSYLVGQIRPGDVMTIGEGAHTVTNMAQAGGNQISALQITPPLVAQAASDDVVTPTWARDFRIHAGVSGYAAEEIAGTVVVGDMRIILMKDLLVAAGFTGDPAPTDLVIPFAAPWAVKNVSKVMQGNSVLLYDIQIRGNG